MENNYTIVDNDLYKDYAYLDKVIAKTLETDIGFFAILKSDIFNPSNLN